MNFQDHLDKNNEIQQLITSLLNKKDKEIDWEVMSILPDPFNGQDALSCIYRNFKKYTNISVALPVFSLLAYVSSYLVENNCKIKIPKVAKLQDCDTWVVGLADSGSSKTLGKSEIEDAIPFKPRTMKNCSGAAAFAQELFDKNRSLFFRDECAKLLKQIETDNSPMTEIKDYLLQIFDHKEISRKTKTDEVTIEEPCLTLFWLNTIQNYIDCLSKTSLTDGFAQRFLYVICSKDIDRPMENFPRYDTEEIQKQIKEPIKKLFSTGLHETYFISEEAIKNWDIGFKYISDIHFNGTLEESFYRRIFFSAHKYSVFYHLILGKTDNIIDCEDMNYGLKVCLLHAYSLKKVIKYKEVGYEADTEKKSKILLKVCLIKKDCKEKGIEFNARILMRRMSAIKNSRDAEHYIKLSNEVLNK